MVERQLVARGLDRAMLGREEFLAEVERWREESGGRILEQLQELGASLDWSREQFTLSPKFSRAVTAAFTQLMERGLLYRSEQLVNWVPALQSTIADMEVDHLELAGPTELSLPGWQQPVQFGVITDLAYKVVGSLEEVVVSTTRPETLPGDVAVAVHPSDSRYSHLVGGAVIHPLTGAELPVLADTAVQPEFGTGAVKVTPGHDLTDWEIGQRHGLPVLTVMDGEGRMCEAGQLTGLHRWQARHLILAELRERGLVRGQRDHAMAVPTCSRTGDVVEPLARPQWFLRTEQLAALACRAVEEGDLTLDPPEFKAVWQQFLGAERGRDWCVSRQIWWGHRVPAYHCTAGSGEHCWVAAGSEEEARVKAASQLSVPAQSLNVEQDTDVLDTWFSSALYPFAAFGWPEQTEDLARFYPLDLMETGHDILFFWVGRMVMLGIALTGRLPFPAVLLHGVVCDQQGRKMSKSLGNTLDPLHLVRGASLQQLQAELQAALAAGRLTEEERAAGERGLAAQWPDGVPRCGADPLRWALASYDLRQRQISLNPTVVQSAGAWCNKLWQLARFTALAHARQEGGKAENLPSGFQPSLMDMWVLHQLAATVQQVNTAMERRDLQAATKQLRRFVYSDLCDTYVEFVKPGLAEAAKPEFLPSLLILHSCVISSLKMLHPIMPFITEELYQRLPCLPKEKRKESIMIDHFPQPTEWNSFHNENLSSTVSLALSAVTAVRSVRSELKIPSSARPGVQVVCETEELQQCGEVIERLARCGEVTFTQHRPATLLPGAVEVSDGDGEVTVIVDAREHRNLDLEIRAVEEKLQVIERKRVKLEKSLKGKFKFRKTADSVAAIQAELDTQAEKLNEQRETLLGLKSLSSS